MHSDVDLLLDTFPYNGGTTNYTAIAMGVPVITYAGNTPASRSGVGILSIAGIEKDFVAYSREEFIEKAVYWHTHLQDLQTLRRQLRERIQQSPRFDPAIVTRGFEKAMQLMWARYCEDLPVTSFVVNDEMS
jgi:predicted O-linked N-acetylglucosamine transferase (SPINDLY family)